MPTNTLCPLYPMGEAPAGSGHSSTNTPLALSSPPVPASRSCVSPLFGYRLQGSVLLFSMVVVCLLSVALSCFGKERVRGVPFFGERKAEL